VFSENGAMVQGRGIEMEVDYHNHVRFQSLDGTVTAFTGESGVSVILEILIIP
jgi:hypothetical protein